ncbi:alpha/beta fold hydrolase [Pseudomonas sp. BN411]|uniref:alpha/beta fold hydrolase n=1 Tax=Pseudomonas sp. BN411 TaxID=2567887 RepID=UPI0024547D10|nr:alpha/beta fold hydrolase [Pseudomonas sp. BN411]MDH4563961.1 alpha/beta fold hydrolase [Pseudomonas sp. BN411]
MEETPTTLVLLPGLLNDERLWAHQAAALADEVDIHIPDLTRDDSIAAMARRVLDEAPEQFALAALSMGGYVAFEIMRQAPERVLRLALFDTMASLDSPERAATRKGLLELAERGRFVGVSPQLMPRLIHPRWLDSQVSATVQQMASAVGKDGFVRQQQAIIKRDDSLPMLGDIQVPTLIVVGADDQLTPVSEAWLMHERITGSRLEILEHCGHLPPLEEPELTTILLREWLAVEFDGRGVRDFVYTY